MKTVHKPELSLLPRLIVPALDVLRGKVDTFKRLYAKTLSGLDPWLPNIRWSSAGLTCKGDRASQGEL